MRKAAIKLFLILAMTVTSISVFAQVVYYGYDAIGNRVEQYSMIIHVPQKTKSTGTLGDVSISFYPNPTPGQSKIELSGTSIPEVVDAAIYNMSGQLAMSFSIENGISDIDLSGFASGMYVMVISLNGERHAIQIIKN